MVFAGYSRYDTPKMHSRMYLVLYIEGQLCRCCCCCCGLRNGTCALSLSSLYLVIFALFRLACEGPLWNLPAALSILFDASPSPFRFVCHRGEHNQTGKSPGPDSITPAYSKHHIHVRKFHGISPDPLALGTSRRSIIYIHVYHHPTYISTSFAELRELPKSTRAHSGHPGAPSPGIHPSRMYPPCFRQPRAASRPLRPIEGCLKKPIHEHISKGVGLSGPSPQKNAF